jgi:cyclohexanone monooxygenase
VVPVIAQQAAQLCVFQRTPNFSIPSRNGPMTEAYAQSWKSEYPARRKQARHMRTGILSNPNDISALEISEQERRRIYEERWAAGGTNFMAAFNDLILDREANDTAAEFVRDKIRETVRDRATAELLAPKNHPIGTKRICVDTDYYGTFNRANVTLVDVRSTPISEITAQGVRAGEVEYALDALVFATGFDAMTGAPLAIDVEADGQTLREKWEAGRGPISA